MPRNDYQDTKRYIPNLLDDPNIPYEQKSHLQRVQHRYIHEGSVVNTRFTALDGIEACFPTIGFDCLYTINDQICPRFVLEFYSCVRTFNDINGNVFLHFKIKNQNITQSITELGNILGVPSYGQCVYTEDHSLESLYFNIESEGPYLTELPDIQAIKQHVSIRREVHTHQRRDGTVLNLDPNWIYVKEILPDLRSWELLLHENVISLAGNRDHVPACLAHMLFCLSNEVPYNLAYYMVKRMVDIHSRSDKVMPYGMLLTRLHRWVMAHFPHLETIY